MQNLTPEEKALLDDFLLDGEDFCDLVGTEKELPIVRSLAEKKYVEYHDCLGKQAFPGFVSAYKTPVQKWIKFIEDIYYDGTIPANELSDEEKQQVLEYLKLKFGL
jgi:hypothetical protein